MNRSVWAVAAVLVCACEQAVSFEDAGSRPDRPVLPDAGPPADLDGYIEWQMGAGGLPGAAAAILLDGEIAWTGRYGFADIEASRPVDDHTLFSVASISKTIAVIRALQLAERGILSLDAPIETYVPYAVRHPSHTQSQVTLRMLLTHTSGMQDNFARLAAGTVYGRDGDITLAAFAEGYVSPGGTYYSDTNWGPRPGTRRVYCNAAFAVIGDAIERAGGARFPDQTEQAIFAPLAMDGAGWFVRDVDASRLAIGYGYNGVTFARQEHAGFAFYPASSLRVSILGLSRFLLAIAGGGRLDDAQILTPASVDELLRAQVPSIDGGQALTFSARRVGEHDYVGHSGATYGGSAQMLLSRDRRHGILLLTNSDAYIRDRFGLTDGADAMERILERLDREAYERRD